MKTQIAGLGWVTPLGVDLETVWRQMLSGAAAVASKTVNPESGRELAYIAVPPKLVEALGRNPRLRRSSAISYFAAAAGLAAIENAGLTISPEMAKRTAVVFGVSDGGVQYTRRFYDQIARKGPASPLLFPETVYNAPASHLSALLGIDGASYTLVGDASVGLSALHFAAQLLATSDIDQCVVVGAEENDWVLCEAYRHWRLARTPLAEGAAAVVLSRQGTLTLETHPGATFFRQAGASAALDGVLAELARGGVAQTAFCSANGTFIDQAESAALDRHFPGIETICPKRSFGEAPGAGALLQTVAAAMAVQTGHASRALVSVIGFNQQAGAAVIGSG